MAKKKTARKAPPAAPKKATLEVAPTIKPAATATPTKLSKAATFIVAIGASAGGLEALGRFFAAMPSGSGLAFVVLQHLSPDHRSFMVELLSKRTALPVQRAEDGVELAPEHIYLLPPGKDLKIFKGRLVLVEPTTIRGIHLPIDIFFRSLAEDQGQGAIGMVLSGTGSDGTSGIRAIKDAGGVVFVQSEDSAQFNGMPRSAISTGLADFIGPPEELPALLLRYVQHPLARSDEALNRHPGNDDALSQRLFTVLREHNGVDFSNYKPATIDRRIQRRMTINQLNTLEEYTRYLESSPRESQLLFNELLISVTRFFRDPETWENLAKEALPKLLEKSSEGEPFRVWMPACATGEEAYTLAILLTEVMELMAITREIKIFATDVSKSTVELAAIGIYSESVVADLSPERLSRFFVQTAEGYQVSGPLRRMVVFARHNLINDPPFTRLDLISCRNLLIYFQPVLQAKVLSSFHFALKPEGILFLGTSETVGELVDRYQPISVRHKIYRRRPGARAADVMMVGPIHKGPSLLRPALGMRGSRLAEYRASIDAITRDIIHDHVPACIVVDENYDILHTFGQAGDYLRHPEGPPTNNLLKLTAHNFGSALVSAFRKASQSRVEFIFENVRYKQGRTTQHVRLRVKPLLTAPAAGPVYIVYVINKNLPAKKGASSENYTIDRTAARQIKDLEQELEHAKESVQSTVEELEASNEELQASNEELLASNEELQSTNEELQSLNEELHTVNSENQARIQDLLQLTDDINNLLTCSQIGTMLIDEQLRIRRMSTAITSMTRLTNEDIGAPLEVLGRLLGASIIDMVQQVQTQLGSSEMEVRTIDGRMLLLRAAPFRVDARPTRGITLTMIDVSERLESEQKLAKSFADLEHTRAFLQATIDAMPASIAVVNNTGVITHVNASWSVFASDNGCHPKGVGVGTNYFDACLNCVEGQLVHDGLRRVIKGETKLFTHEYPCDAPQTKRWFRVYATPLQPVESGILVCHIDISDLHFGT